MVILRGKKANLNTIFGERVRKYRLENSWSQDELAYRAGLHRTYVGGVERGERNVTLETVDKLAKALNVHPCDLLK